MIYRILGCLIQKCTWWTEFGMFWQWTDHIILMWIAHHYFPSSSCLWIRRRW